MAPRRHRYRSQRESSFPLRSMKVLSLVSLLIFSNAVPQHRVRKARRSVAYHQHEKLPFPKFWIPSWESSRQPAQTNTNSRRRLYDGQVEGGAKMESLQSTRSNKTPSLLQEQSVWYIHGDASQCSPEQVYHKTRRRLHQSNENDPRRLSWFQYKLKRVRRRRTVEDEFVEEETTGDEEDTGYALGEKESGYTAGDTDLVYDDASPESSTTNETRPHTWNVSTEVEFGATVDETEDESGNNTNATSSVVYTTTDTNETALFQPIRIRAILSEQGDGGDCLTEDERMVLFQEILSPAIVAWSAALRVDPVIGNLTVDASQLYDGETCGPGRDSGYPSVPVPPSHLEEGIPDTDIVVYLSLAFVTEPNTLNPFTEDLTGSSNATANATNSSADSTNAANDEEAQSGTWSFGEYGLDEEEPAGEVSWPSCTGDYLAAATYCSTDQYDRPTAALLHLCIDDSFFLQRSLERDITTVMHELGHALGFNTQSMAHFRRPDGTPITPRQDDGDVVDSKVECTGPRHSRRSEVLPLPSEEILQFRTVRGVRVAEVVTPSVRLVVRNHFDCQSLAGAELESGIVHVTKASSREVSDEEAVASCIGDHWEKRLFRIDLMNPVVDEIPFSLRFSPVTLALFADSGWYQVDLSRTTFSSSWGRAAGCGFVNDTCVGEYGEIREENKAFFCNEVASTGSREILDEIHGCSPDLSRKAACSIAQYDWELPAEYQYFNSTFGSNVGGSEPLLDYCPVYNGFANGLCKESENQRLLQVNRIEKFGAKNSRCVRGILGTRKTALCLPIACVIEDRTLRVKVDGNWRLCRYSGQRISLSDGQKSHVICPDPVRTCPTFYCHRDCLGTGGICNYTSGSCSCSLETENGTITGKCAELNAERPDYETVFYDDNAAKPLEDSSLSDYYVPTERALQDDSDRLEVWMIAVIVIGGVVAVLLLALCIRTTWRNLSVNENSWFLRPDDSTESVIVETLPTSNKDKFVASMLVDLRVNGGLRSTEDSQAESITETEGSCTETESSGQFTKCPEDQSFEPFDELDRDQPETTSYRNPEDQGNERSEMPVSVMRKRIIPDSS